MLTKSETIARTNARIRKARVLEFWHDTRLLDLDMDDVLERFEAIPVDIEPSREDR